MDLAALLEAFSYPAVFLALVACGLGAPLSEELIVLSAGVAAAKGYGTWSGMAFGAYAGTVAGDGILYFMGRTLGPRVFAHPRLGKALTPARVERLQAYFFRRGTLTLLAARVVPGLRAPTFLVAGMSRVPLRQFFTVDALASLVTAPVLTWLGFRFGLAALPHVQWGARWLLGSVAAVLIAYGMLGIVRKWRARRAAQQALPVPVPEPLKTLPTL